MQSLERHISPKWLIWGVAAVIFILASSNGRPAWTSSGIFIFIICPIIIFIRNFKFLFNSLINKKNIYIFISLILIFIANVMSTLANPSNYSMIAVLQHCILPFLVYLACIDLKLRERDVIFLICALCAGLCVMFLRGLVAYYSEFGIPDLGTILWSRFDKVRISGYSDATLGNVGNIGSFIILTLSPVIYSIFKYKNNFSLKLYLYFVVAIGFCNLIISGSRTALILFLLSIMITMLSLGLRRFFVVFIFLGFLLIISLPAIINLIADPDLIRRYVPFIAEGNDQSANVRWLSIIDGWHLFLDHPMFGVGPSMSQYYMIDFVPHQSLVYFLAELGIFGGTSFILLNISITYIFVKNFRKSHSDISASYRILWLFGPFLWLVFGVFAGIQLSSSFALSWIGIFHAMLALSGSTVVLAQPKVALPMRGRP
jgi:O-antigen ligase